MTTLRRMTRKSETQRPVTLEEPESDGPTKAAEPEIGTPNDLMSDPGMAGLRARPEDKD